MDSQRAAADAKWARLSAQIIPTAAAGVLHATFGMSPKNPSDLCLLLRLLLQKQGAPPNGHFPLSLFPEIK